ncbi:MAG: hypothetical protein P8074_21905 [Anaerolineales bacterium]|jgi:hypothetical protein
MSKLPAWQIKFREELERAEAARRAGNEGMARVCARRAAGILIGQYIQEHDLPRVGPSAYNRLKYLAARHELPSQVREVAGHFLVRITPEHDLPVEADLIAEARWLKDILIELEEDSPG